MGPGALSDEQRAMSSEPGSRLIAQSSKLPRVLWVSPKPEFKAAMIFVERQIESLLAAGVEGRTFHLQSRTAPRVMAREWRRLRAEIRDSAPTWSTPNTARQPPSSRQSATRRPLVVTFRGSDLNPDPEKGRLRCLFSRWMSQFAAWRAAHIICVSDQLVERLWCGRSKDDDRPVGHRYQSVLSPAARRGPRQARLAAG